ncbi:hypothetical protein DFH07DRAFT_842356 [Mycena maculata]|uniref:Uncharacterized protein n=1 Tax=Mycena maculata TaxID=230809 RepID=A0AAD7I831_9AGAR|nr:hypothetical protein DFH07DRAFT_842356 [Mycena maculata]
MFAQITHLEIFDDPAMEGYNPQILCNLAMIPQLTHLAIEGGRGNLIDLWLTLLRTCRSLHVLLVFLFSAQTIVAFPPQPLEILANDARFVSMEQQGSLDWQMGVHTGHDYWARAEDLVVRRRLQGKPPFRFHRENGMSVIWVYSEAGDRLRNWRSPTVSE